MIFAKMPTETEISKNGTLNISPSPVRIFITNAIRIEVMPECPPELFRVLIQGLKDHALIWQVARSLAKREKSSEEMYIYYQNGGTLLYEKIAGFTDTFLRIGDNLSGLQRDYDKAYNQLSDGNGSVVRQAELLRNMSLTPKKRISARLLPKEEETEEEENGQDKYNIQI